MYGILEKLSVIDSMNLKFFTRSLIFKSFFKIMFWALIKILVEKAIPPHSSTLVWKIPWMEEPRRLQPIGSLGVGHDWLHFHFSLSCIGEGNGNPLHYSCLGNPRDGGAWWAAIYEVAQSRTRLSNLAAKILVVHEISACVKCMHWINKLIFINLNLPHFNKILCSF